MKVGDLIKVRYRHAEEAYHGIIYESPDTGPNCTWKMWCIERAKVHIISPTYDLIEVVSSSDISLTKEVLHLLDNGAIFYK